MERSVERRYKREKGGYLGWVKVEENVVRRP